MWSAVKKPFTPSTSPKRIVPVLLIVTSSPAIRPINSSELPAFVSVIPPPAVSARREAEIAAADASIAPPDNKCNVLPAAIVNPSFSVKVPAVSEPSRSVPYVNRDSSPAESSNVSTRSFNCGPIIVATPAFASSDTVAVPAYTTPLSAILSARSVTPPAPQIPVPDCVSSSEFSPSRRIETVPAE